jgi:glycosyltransferase involved in cell wall biosynthesis
LAEHSLPALKFIVIGPRNRFTNKLALAAEREGRSSNLSIEGYVEDSAEAIRRVNVVVSFSTFAESFGRTLVEAMAARRPVIAYGLGAIPEIVRDGVDGFIIPPLDIERALLHLEALANDAELVATMGNSGHQRAKEMFAPTVFASKLNEIYGRILETWSGPEPSRLCGL